MENKKDMILKVLNNKEVPRVPVGLWWHFADEYYQFRGLIESEVIKNNIEGHKRLFDDLEPDMVKIMSDGFFGHPSIMENDINNIDDIKKIKSIGDSSPWYDEQIKMVNEILEYFKDEVFAIYNIFSPLNFIRLYTECYKQKPELFVELFMEDPEAMANAANEISKDLVTLVKRLKSETKLDGIYYSVQATQAESADLDFHNKYVKDSDLKVLYEINNNWENNILHICGYGDYTNDLSFYTDYKAKVYNWAVNTENISLKQGKDMFNNACVLGGFDNNKGTLLDVGPDELIEEKVKDIIKETDGIGVIIGADCTVSEEIGFKRLNQLKEYGKK